MNGELSAVGFLLQNGANRASRGRQGFTAMCVPREAACLAFQQAVCAAAGRWCWAVVLSPCGAYPDACWPCQQHQIALGRYELLSSTAPCHL